MQSKQLTTPELIEYYNCHPVNKNITSKIQFINDQLSNGKELYGLIASGKRIGSIGKIVTRVSTHNNSRVSWYKNRNKPVGMKIGSRKLCSYSINIVMVMPDYTGECVFVEEHKKDITPLDFLGQPIKVGNLIYFSRGADAVMANVNEVRDNGHIIVKPIKINEESVSRNDVVRLNLTTRALVISKNTLNNSMLLKLKT